MDSQGKRGVYYHSTGLMPLSLCSSLYHAPGLAQSLSSHLTIKTASLSLPPHPLPHHTMPQSTPLKLEELLPIKTLLSVWEKIFSKQLSDKKMYA